jgi:hypothetical protein
MAKDLKYEGPLTPDELLTWANDEEREGEHYPEYDLANRYAKFLRTMAVLLPLIEAAVNHECTDECHEGCPEVYTLRNAWNAG